MSDINIKKCKKLQGAVNLPGDKSISHRAALISLLCQAPINIRNFSDAVDCKRSLDAVSALGGNISFQNETITIKPPENGIQSPANPIDCGNSGTTMRLLTGLLSGANVTATMIGDESLSQRPMKRIIEPLKQMNAAVRATEEGTAPLEIEPARIIPIEYTLPVASAQVKSAMLLAGLASGTTVTVREKVLTRDHTERMIKYLGGDISIEDIKLKTIPDPDDPRKKRKIATTDEYKRSSTINTKAEISGGDIEVPGDISTAAFFIAAALIVPDSHLIIKNVGINSTRMGFMTVARLMGANMAIKNKRDISGEPVADIEVHSSDLKSRKISGDIIPGLIDEIPILAVLAATVEGTTIIRDAEELRFKESDRIKSTVKNLSAMGVKVGEFPDGLAIEGTGELEGAEIDSFGDHRIAMAFAVAGLVAHGETILKNSDSVDISCPEFFNMLEGLRVR